MQLGLVNHMIAYHYGKWLSHQFRIKIVNHELAAVSPCRSPKGIGPVFTVETLSTAARRVSHLTRIAGPNGRLTRPKICPKVSPMIDAETIEQRGRNALGTTFLVAGLAAGVIATIAPGVLSVFASVAAALCWAGAITASLPSGESAFERECRECDPVELSTVGEPAPGECLEPGQGERWRQTVAASRTAGRNR